VKHSAFFNLTPHAFSFDVSDVVAQVKSMEAPEYLRKIKKEKSYEF